MDKTTLPQHSPPPSHYLPFVELGRLGRLDWWRFAIAGLLLLLIPALLGIRLMDLLHHVDPGLERAIHHRDTSGWEAGYPLWLGVVAFSRWYLIIAFMLPAALAVVPLVHCRPWQTLIVASDGFAWHGFFASLVATIAVFGALELLPQAFRHEGVHVVFDAGQFAAFLVPFLLLVPAQTLAEEVVYRGYVLQSVAAVTDSITLRLAIPSILFAAVHLPNVSTTGGLWAFIHHMVLAVYMTFLVMRWNGLAHAWGVHLGWNWMVTLIVPAGPVYEPQPAILALDHARADPTFLMMTLLMVGCAAHYWLMGYLMKRWRRKLGVRP